MKILLVIAIITVMTVPNASASFKQFHHSDGIYYYVDLENMIRVADEIMVWTRHEEPAPIKHQVEFATEFQLKLSCSKTKYTILQSITYRSNQEILYKSSGSYESSIIPDTHGSILADIVCGRKSLP